MRPARALPSGALVLALLGCSVRPEHFVIDEFFTASGLRDLTALSRFSLVVIEPREAGTVGEPTIRSVSETRRTPLDPEGHIAQLSMSSLVSLLGSAESQAQIGSVGEIETEDVTLTAPLRTPDGRTADVTFVVTLDRAVVGAGRRPGRWVVTAVTAFTADTTDTAFRGAVVARALPRP